MSEEKTNDYRDEDLWVDEYTNRHLFIARDGDKLYYTTSYIKSDLVEWSPICNDSALCSSPERFKLVYRRKK